MVTKNDSKVIPQERIHRGMTIDEILNRFAHRAQRIAQELTDAGLHCVGCQAATWETLEAGMRGHGMDESAIDSMVDRLNAIIEQKVDASTITLTPQAAKKFLAILEEEGRQGAALRFGVKKGGCSGFQYELDYSSAAGDDDTIFISQGIEIHVDNRNLEKLIGSEIDYVDRLQGGGFKISNPNARRSCGCGSSQAY